MTDTPPSPYIRDLLHQVRERLVDLEPLVEEYRRLEIADKALGGEYKPEEVKK